MNDLTPKQENFCQQYLLLGNASDAYRLAYDAKNMKPETINRRAKDLLDDGKITARLNFLSESSMSEFSTNFAEKQRKLWEIIEYGSEEIEVKTGILKQRNPSATVSAINQLNLMDGSHAAFKARLEANAPHISNEREVEQVALQRVRRTFTKTEAVRLWHLYYGDKMDYIEAIDLIESERKNLELTTTANDF